MARLGADRQRRPDDRFQNVSERLDANAHRNCGWLWPLEYPGQSFDGSPVKAHADGPNLRMAAAGQV